ncbi:hypothetical protein [Microscilla marina]|uniref:Uncharacterized protein n=1 Tax=Microscilla marina ATCC 23134 TaxID=313606 RepID=A1ZUC0_MICM2|nr:hypothetical protein [Microscilla marina]EAY26091.1 hypothetical protein M23134_06440 [Microscilla marina ATCC 23134]
MATTDPNKWRKVIDVLLSEVDGDLAFENGDFALGDATVQHQAHHLVANKGDLRATPQAGVGLHIFLGDENRDLSEMRAEIELQLELDGQTIESVRIDLTQGEGHELVQIEAGWSN